MGVAAAESIRVVVIDDHLVVRDSIARLLSQAPGIEVVGVAASMGEGAETVRREHPDVALIDLDLPDGSGVQLLEELQAVHPGTRCVALTGSDSLDDLDLVLAAGAGFVTKTAHPDQLIAAIRDAHHGKSPVVASFDVDGGRMPGLTPREREVLKRVAEGFSSKEIASQLELSPATVDTHRHRLTRKLGLRHRWELVRYALDHGILR